MPASFEVDEPGGDVKSGSLQRLTVATESFTLLPENSGKHAAEETQASNSLSTRETIANFVVYLVGAGILILPKTMADVGILTASVLMVIAFFTTFVCANMVVICCERVESMASMSASSLVQSYEALANHVLGVAGTTSVTVAKNGYLLGVLTVFILLVIDGVGEWVQLEVQIIRWCIVAPLFVIFGMIRDLKQIKRFAGLGVFAAFSQCALLGLGAGVTMGEPNFVFPHRDLMRGTLLDVGAAMATCLFSCGSVVCTIPSVRAQMAHPKQLSSALRTALAIVLVMYLCVMSLCYSAFGLDIKGNALQNISVGCQPIRCWLGQAGAALMTTNLCISSPGVAFFIISVFEATGRRQVCIPMSVQNIACRAALMVALVLIGMVLPHPNEFIGLVSASFGGCNCLVFPMLLHYGLKYKHGSGQSDHHWSRDLIVHTGVAMVAVVAMVFGVAGAYKKLLAKLSG